AEDGTWRMDQDDVDRVMEFRKCIECFLCQDVCHVLRTHDKHHAFQGPRMMIHYAQMEMHPGDEGDRVDEIWDEGGIGYCNITKCCTDVCPENINLTDNGIIPMKERVVTRKFDPIAMLWRKVTGKS
ncbi:MAG: 4Fe-4S dicluster domain-containing protein, partial [Candidatus Thermoplasmatota archaeon]|nr:4Fe-4S dicluster domain-containing protein [Candidatus Thermoplasmatota archaeon]